MLLTILTLQLFVHVIGFKISWEIIWLQGLMENCKFSWCDMNCAGH